LESLFGQAAIYPSSMAFFFGGVQNLLRNEQQGHGNAEQVATRLFTLSVSIKLLTVMGNSTGTMDPELLGMVMRGKQKI